MPVFIAALIGGLVSAAGSFVGRVLIALGVGFVSYQGIDIAMDQLRSIFISSAGGLPGYFAGMLGILKVGTAFNIVASSLAIRLVLAGLTGGAIKRMVLK
jgi:hypothetical protein